MFTLKEALEVYHKYCVKNGEKEEEIRRINQRIETIFYQLNCRRKPEKAEDFIITYSQFCMAAINENVLINSQKIERAFNLFDEVSSLFKLKTKMTY